MQAETLADRVSRIRWWHRIDLGSGIITPGLDDSFRKLTIMHLPESLLAKTVLDVGAWDGFFSFEAERRGAVRVVAADLYNWRHPRFGKQGFQLAKTVLQSNVEELDADILELSTDQIGKFDVVLFMGVLYHLRHPLLGLERVRSLTKELLILESHTDLQDLVRPAMVFYPGSELNNDGTNWWGPNLALIRAMLQDVGFRKLVEYPHFERNRTVIHAFP